MPAILPKFPFRLHTTPWIEEGLVVGELNGYETLSGPYTFTSRVFVPTTITLSELPAVGQPATIAMQSNHQEDVPSRMIQGILSKVTHNGTAYDRGGVWLTVKLVPRLWKLKYKKHRRIFQNKTVQQIVGLILNPHRVSHMWRADGPFELIAYCVQYDESDFVFLQRLLARFGLFYFFEHSSALPDNANAYETMIVCSHAEQYNTITHDGSPEPRVLKLVDRVGTFRPVEAVASFRYSRTGRSTRGDLRSWDYRNPQVWAEGGSVSDHDPAWSVNQLSVEEFEQTAGNDDLKANKKQARVALEQHRRDAGIGQGTSDCMTFAPGYRFNLNNHDVTHLNVNWVLSTVRHRGVVPEFTGKTTQDRQMPPMYENEFECVFADVPLRPSRPTRILRQVTETAIVVGPQGEEIYTDALGRIKLQFLWDQQGQWNDYSSCWVRVAQTWAGNGWGFQFIPRIGMEVIVTFIAGDTDQPLVTGCVRNNATAMIHPLPEQKSRSGIRTSSTPGCVGGNELSFEDASGEEEVYLRAQRNLREWVGQDHMQQVLATQRIEVASDRNVRVLRNQVHTITEDDQWRIEGNRIAHVNKNDQISVSGNQVSSIDGTHQTNIKQDDITTIHGDRVVSVNGNSTQQTQGSSFVSTKDSAFVSVGNAMDLRVNGNFITGISGSVAHIDVADLLKVISGSTIEISASDKVVFKVGDSQIQMTPDKIVLSAERVVINATSESKVIGASAEIRLADTIHGNGQKIELSANSSLLSLSSVATIKGSQIQLTNGVGSSSANSQSPTDQNETRYWEIRLMKENSEASQPDEPVQQKSFIAKGHGPKPYQGQTDADGILRIPIVYERALIEIDLEGDLFEVFVELGATKINPQERLKTALHRLGFGPRKLSLWNQHELQLALDAFQRKYGHQDPESV